MSADGMDSGDGGADMQPELVEDGGPEAADAAEDGGPEAADAPEDVGPEAADAPEDGGPAVVDAPEDQAEEGITSDDIEAIKAMVESDAPPLDVLQAIVVQLLGREYDPVLKVAQQIVWSRVVADIKEEAARKKKTMPLGDFMRMVQGATMMAPAMPPAELLQLAKNLEDRFLLETANLAFKKVDDVVSDMMLPYARYLTAEPIKWKSMHLERYPFGYTEHQLVYGGKTSRKDPGAKEVPYHTLLTSLGVDVVWVPLYRVEDAATRPEGSPPRAYAVGRMHDGFDPTAFTRTHGMNTMSRKGLPLEGTVRFCPNPITKRTAPDDLRERAAPFVERSCGHFANDAITMDIDGVPAFLKHRNRDATVIELKPGVELTKKLVVAAVERYYTEIKDKVNCRFADYNGVLCLASLRSGPKIKKKDALLVSYTPAWWYARDADDVMMEQSRFASFIDTADIERIEAKGIPILRYCMIGYEPDPK